MVNKPPINIALPPRHVSQTVTQWVYAVLRSAVMAGQIPPGRLLTIRELASVLQVSAMPVREALRQLAAENALEIQESRRVRVPPMTAMKFTELFEARIALESHTAARALPYISQATVSEIRALDLLIRQAKAAQQHENLRKFNRQFHQTIYLANPHQVTMPLIESIWLQLGPFMRIAHQSQHDQHFVDRHNEIIIAIENRDAFALQVAIAADIREGFAFATNPERLQKIIHNE